MITVLGSESCDAGLYLEWRDIHFEVELSDVAAKAQTPRGGVPQRSKTILHGVSAQAPSNTLMAVMVRCLCTVRPSWALGSALVSLVSAKKWDSRDDK